MPGALKEKMEKVWGWFGMDQSEDRDDDTEEYEDPEVEEVDLEEEEDQDERKLWGRKNKVVNMPQVQQVKVVISQPTNFDQAFNICDLLKQKKSVIVNLEYISKEDARRIIDVVYGAVLALDGHMEKISTYIVLVAPTNYDIENEMARNAVKSKMMNVSWMKNANNQ